MALRKINGGILLVMGTTLNGLIYDYDLHRYELRQRRELYGLKELAPTKAVPVTLVEGTYEIVAEDDELLQYMINVPVSELSITALHNVPPTDRFAKVLVSHSLISTNPKVFVHKGSQVQVINYGTGLTVNMADKEILFAEFAIHELLYAKKDPQHHVSRIKHLMFELDILELVVNSSGICCLHHLSGAFGKDVYILQIPVKLASFKSSGQPLQPEHEFVYGYVTEEDISEYLQFL